MVSIRSDLQEQIGRAVQEAKTELRTEFAAILNKKVVLLEARVEARFNEVREGTTSTLKELKSIVVAACKRKEKILRAIDGMSKEVHELVQDDVGIDGGEDTEPMLAKFKLAEEESILVAESSIDPQPNSMTKSPTLFT